MFLKFSLWLPPNFPLSVSFLPSPAPPLPQLSPKEGAIQSLMHFRFFYFLLILTVPKGCISSWLVHPFECWPRGGTTVQKVLRMAKGLAATGKGWPLLSYDMLSLCSDPALYFFF